MAEDDLWSKGGEQTREDVRAIFAKHAAHGPAAAEPEQLERRATLPNFLKLPAHGWRLLGWRGRTVVVALGCAIVALAIILGPKAIDTGEENREIDRATRAANRERLRQELIEEQKPHTAQLKGDEPFAAGLAAAVGADAERRVESGELTGPLRRTTCEPIHRTGEDPAFASFTCLAEIGSGGVYQGRPLVSGYRFRGRVEKETGAAVWCKEEPRPLHPDQEEYIDVPLARSCTG
jgi:hypothetical protein